MATLIRMAKLNKEGKEALRNNIFVQGYGFACAFEDKRKRMSCLDRCLWNK